MTAATSLLVFRIEGTRIAVDLQHVERVVRAAALSPIPGAPDTVHGLLNLNGIPVPIVNLRKKLGLGADAELDTNDEIIIFRNQQALIGIVVDEVEDVKPIKEFDLNPIAEEADLPHLTSAANIGGKIVLVHNIEKFLSSKEEHQLATAIIRSLRP
ncbi:MAG: chemotaxis protein CheW [Candidatus Obscuribacterales bacterium]|jgi:purine-binding chemotaxis protein CheW|nr:chemotaxis protein CheW [Candidatus Obscuribacterales bacterium]